MFGGLGNLFIVLVLRPSFYPERQLATNRELAIFFLSFHATIPVHCYSNRESSHEFLWQNPLGTCIDWRLSRGTLCLCGCRSCLAAMGPAPLTLRRTTCISGGLLSVRSLGRAQGRFALRLARNSGWSCCHAYLRRFNPRPTRTLGLHPRSCLENHGRSGRRSRCRQTAKVADCSHSRCPVMRLYPSLFILGNVAHP